MASIHNGLSRYTELSRGAKLSMGLDSEAGGLERLGETLTPVWDPFGKPEYAFPRGEMLATGGYILSAVVAEYPKIAFHAGGTERIYVLERCVLKTSGACNVQIRQSVTALASAGAKGFRDSRRLAWDSATLVPTGRVTYVSDGTTPGTVIGYIGMLANEPLPLQLDFVLHAGYGLVFLPDTTNMTFAATFWWRERQLLPGELAR